MIPRHTHKRSYSSENRTLLPDKTVIKAKSTTNLTEIVSKSSAPSHHPRYEESNFNTLQDPRLAISTEDLPSTPSEHHPDLSNEVAALSVKLIQAINNQTILDDKLVATRQELEMAHCKIQTLESQNQKYHRDLDERVYIKKSDADHEILQLKAVIAEERAQRAVVEKGKKTIEQELEALTADLFEEANKMVAAAKIEREAVEKKNEQLRAQIKDTELLLASHQDQLAELKSVMQQMKISKDDVDTRTSTSTAPPSPSASSAMRITKQEPQHDQVSLTLGNIETLTPGPACNFPQFIRLVCRTDLQAYEDFRELLVLSRSSKPPSRAGSGSYAGLNVMSLAGFGSGASNSVTSSPTKAFSHSPNGSISSQVGSHVHLKETRFYKRVLLEDIEPTLRLDLAPGISWLTRRTVLSSICEGTLLVEPLSQGAKAYEFACSVCGERRPGPHNERTHRFRTSDSENAQQYPLCVQCLERVRSCCEFTGYLRLILDGHLRAGDADEEKDVWEETIRLRERMFWSRIAGGVVPLVTRSLEAGISPDNTEFTTDGLQINERQRLHMSGNITAECQVVERPETPESLENMGKLVNHDLSMPEVRAAGISSFEPDIPRKVVDDDTASVTISKGFSIGSNFSIPEEADGDETITPCETPKTDAGDPHEVHNEVAEVVDPNAQPPAGVSSEGGSESTDKAVNAEVQQPGLSENVLDDREEP